MIPVAVSSAGGKIVPPKPTISKTALGQFTITNFNAALTYNLSVNNGTVSRSNAVITLSATSAICTIVCVSEKGIPNTTLCERKPFVYTCRTVSQTCSQGCNCALVGGNCYCVAGPCTGSCPASGQCGCVGSCTCGSIGTIVCQTCYYDCSYTACDVLTDETANGYTNGSNEWFKVT